MTRELKVGLFVIAGLALSMAGIFLIGNTTRLWDPKAEYRTAFADVAGLKPGAPVRMGGLDIGSVTSVGYNKDLGDTRIFANMSKKDMLLLTQLLRQIVVEGGRLFDTQAN